jgi:hypothetical protein
MVVVLREQYNYTAFPASKHRLSDKFMSIIGTITGLSPVDLCENCCSQGGDY